MASSLKAVWDWTGVRSLGNLPCLLSGQGKQPTVSPSTEGSSSPRELSLLVSGGNMVYSGSQFEGAVHHSRGRHGSSSTMWLVT